MKAAAFALVNLLLVAVFLAVARRKDFLSYFRNGKWWLSWLAIGIITLMDELTSIYYAPYEAYRYIGLRAIVYIALTSLLIRYLSNRMVEIAEILEVNNVKGGGVYSFSYLVMGPTASFIAAASILVAYVLTAAISTVSAVENGTTFLAMSAHTKYALKFGVVWCIAGLNVLGIRENAKFTFGVFVVAGFALINLILGGVLRFDAAAMGRVSEGVRLAVSDVRGVSFFGAYGNVIAGIGSCILAYSGVESVLQTASFAWGWRDIKKAYLFLALTVGIVTPLVALLALAGTPDLPDRATDLIPAFGGAVNGRWFGIAISALASITLVMAVNTAMVASAEMIEKAGEKYSFRWLIAVNQRQSLYRIHLLNAVFYTLVIAVTSGSQQMLAEMYAVGLVASFGINVLALVIYRYSKGTKEIPWRGSRLGTVLLLVLLASLFVYIAMNRPVGAMLWIAMTALFLAGGWRIAKSRAPEIPVRRASATPMDVVFAVCAVRSPDVHIHLCRPREESGDAGDARIYVSFYSPRVEQPGQARPNRFWISVQERTAVFDMIVGLLETLSYDVPAEKRLHLHFGWPLSSWMDRMAIGVMVFNVMSLPKRFPNMCFHIDYSGGAK